MKKAYLLEIARLQKEAELLVKILEEYQINREKESVAFGEWLGKNKEYFEGKWYDVENPNSKDVLTSLNAYYGQTTEELFQIFKFRQ